MTHQEIIFKVKETIKKHDPRARIILFGSRARGNFNTGSERAGYRKGSSV